MVPVAVILGHVLDVTQRLGCQRCVANRVFAGALVRRATNVRLLGLAGCLRRPLLLRGLHQVVDLGQDQRRIVAFVSKQMHDRRIALEPR